MSERGSALVLVQPGDSVEAVALRVRQTGSRDVSLLVPADNAAFQIRKNVLSLNQALRRAGVSLIVISSDERVLNAARFSGIEAIAIEGVSVAGPLLPQPARAVRTPEIGKVAVAGSEPGDAEMLALLDEGEQMPTAPVLSRLPAQAVPADELAASLGDLAALEEQPPIRPAAEPVSGGVPAKPPLRSAPQRGGHGEPARDRVGRRDEGRDAPRSAARSASQRSEPARRLRPEQEGEHEGAAPTRRSSPMTGLVIAVAVIALLAVGLLWALGSRVSVTVYAPVTRVREVPITDEVIPIGSGSGGELPTVQAAPVSANAEFTVTGQVANQTTSPSGRAKGVVTVINTIEQALELPEGTEFVGRNAQGAEVRFVVDAPVSVPGASTSSSLTGRSTTYGQAQVNVTARSPGAASNVGENTIRQILIPGQQLLDCGTSNFICQSGPIQGGSDEPQWIVTEADVQRVLGDALTGLYNTGLQQLRAQTDALDPTTIMPDPQSLGRPESYEPPIVTPPLGQSADPVTREFQVTVRARFIGLAVPPGLLIKDQLEQMVSTHFAQRSTPICSPAEIATPSIDRWVWDGASLKISGMMVCSPRGALAPETRLQVREALRGKSRADADATLRDLQTEGLIGEYTLPQNVEQLPQFDALLDVQFVDGPAPTP